MIGRCGDAGDAGMTTTEARLGAHAGDTEHRYRPHLDGLRTVAVYLVVAFHAGLGKFSGGFVGVDIFFVLSGYLVTSILFRSLTATGKTNRRRFYSRRVRRILPASLVTLLLTALVFAAIATPADAFGVLDGFRAACLFVANWYFIHQSVDYFAANVNSNPVLHFWSLAVEEQFYLVWPLLLGGLFIVSGRVGRWRWWVLRGTVAVLAAASMIEAWHLGHANLSRAYYGTDSRAYQLLAGAFLAVTPQLFRLVSPARRVFRALALPALLMLIVLATSIMSMSVITRGLAVAFFTSVLIVALEHSPGGTANRWLSTRPMTDLGKVSYGTYLWHWPVIVLLTYRWSISPAPLFAITVVAATGLATISYHMLEHPIRVSSMLSQYQRPVIAVGLTASVLMGLLLTPAILSGNTSVAGAHGLDWRSALTDIPPLPDCLRRPAFDCTVVKGEHPRVLLMGDSMARMWIPAFEKIAKRESLTLSVASSAGCPWQDGIVQQGPIEQREACLRHKRDWYTRVVSALNPDVVVLAEYAYDDPTNSVNFVLPSGRLVSIDNPDFEPALQRATALSLRRLRAPKRKLVLISPIPTPPVRFFNPLSCLSTGKAPKLCGFRANAAVTPLERYFRRRAANESDVKVIDLNRVVCPRWPRCEAVERNTIVWRDLHHVTAMYATSLAPEIEAVLRQQAILRP